MKTPSLLPCLLIGPLTLLGGPATSIAPADITALARDNGEFALALYRKLSASDGNVFLSPYSISAALAMTYAGARGDTERQMAASLHFSLSQSRLHPAFAGLDAQLAEAQRSGGIRLSVANSLWPQKDYALLADYLSLVKTQYGVSVTALDYAGATEAARATINGWVAEKTEQRITDVIQPGDLTPLTRLVLANAIYFKGTWRSEFKVARTRPEPFLLAAGGSVPTPLMTQTLKCRHASLPSLDLVELPYVGGSAAMLVLLPKDAAGLRRLESELTGAKLTSWLGELRQKDVTVFLPKFKVTCRFNLGSTLAEMGMPDAFDVGKANFSGMDGRTDGLFIGSVVHKAFVDVNEEGTEAAAATGVAMAVRSMPSPPVVFRADRPFVFLIQHRETGSILFAGRVADPTKTGGD